MLSTAGVAFDAVPADVVIPAYTAAKEVVLTGRALATGRLELRGVRIVFFGVEREHIGRVERQAAADSAGPKSTSTANQKKSKPKVGDNEVLSIRVIDEMPQLQIQDTHLFATPLQLWDGER